MHSQVYVLLSETLCVCGLWQDPNALDVKVLSDFDHVKKDIHIEDEELRLLREDPTYNINMSDDTRRMLKELGTAKGREMAAVGGGGGKAQREHAAAVAALNAAKQVCHLIRT